MLRFNFSSFKLSWCESFIVQRGLLLFFLLVTAPALLAQTSGTVTGTVTDQGAQTWNNGSYSFTFVPPFGYTGTMYQAGTVLTPAQLVTVTGTLSGTGTFSQVLLTKNNMTPTGATWRFQYCPQATWPCQLVNNVTVASGTQSITSQINPIAIAISLSNPPGPFTTAYADAEISVTPLGGVYYNTTLGAQRVCIAVSGTACTTWVNTSSTGGLQQVTSLPGTCTPGTTSQISLTIGGKYMGIYSCTATNTWTVDAGTATSATSFFPSLISAEYQFPPTETCGTDTDYSGNGNNITSTAGTAPTIIAKTGGCSFGGNGALIVPAALNSAQAITLFVTNYPPGAGGQVHNVLVGGNGNGTTNHCNSVESFQWQPAVSGDNTMAFKVMATANGGTPIDTTLATWGGTGVLTWSWGTTQGGGADDDKVWINGVHPGFINTASALRANQTLGAYQIGGSAAGSCIATVSYSTESVYWAVFWNTEPTDAQEAVVRNFIISQMANRGITVSMTSNTLADQLYMVGDSITAGNGLTETAWHYAANNCGVCFLRPYPSIANSGVTGYTIYNNMYPTYWLNAFPYLGSRTNAPLGGGVSNAMNIFTIWAGTNDAPTTTAQAQTLMDKQNQMCRFWKLNGGDRCTVATMISRTGSDTIKDLYDPIISNFWPLDFDEIVDYAANPNLGADGANASSTYFQGDNVHPNQNSEYNIILPHFLHSINLFAAYQGFSTANSYTSTATAAVTVSNATESGNTMTFTTAANTYQIGNCVTVTGVTPAGYNTPTNQCWTVLTAPNNTTFTAWNNTTGLGNLSVSGSAVAPQEVDADARYATLGQCTTCTHTLEPCAWHIGTPKLLRISSTSAWTITPWNSGETINGGTTFTSPTASGTNNPLVRLDAIRGTAAASGCTWKASLQ